MLCYIGTTYTYFVQQCTMCGECRWYGDGRAGEWELGGGGHTESDCIDSCSEKDLCNYASFSDLGYCHMKDTCDPTSGINWNRFKRGQYVNAPTYITA